MSFTVQTKLPKKGNKFYNTTSKGGYSHCIQGKPTQSGLNVLCNCVGWACGRFNEVYSELSGYKGMKYWQLNCNAEDFIRRGKTIGLNYTKEPVVGGIMVWEGKGSKAGHVAFVEKINNNNQVYTSESGYNSFAFANRTRNKGNGNWGINSDYKYLGCIINPALETNQVKIWQTYMNEQWNCGLAIDGHFGPMCEKEASKHLLYLGVKAPIMVQWLQQRLIELGYSVGKCGVDRSFGYDTEKAVKQFQKDHKLKADGRVGKQTYKALVK